MEPRWTTKDAADYLGLTAQAVQWRALNATLPCTKVLGRFEFEPEVVIAAKDGAELEQLLQIHSRCVGARKAEDEQRATEIRARRAETVSKKAKGKKNDDGASTDAPK